MNLAFDDAILFHRATGVRYSFRGTSKKLRHIQRPLKPDRSQRGWRQ